MEPRAKKEWEHLQELRQFYIDLDQETSDLETEKINIYKEIDSINGNLENLTKELEVLEDKRNTLNTLINEVEKGFHKVEASTKSLYLLASRQLRRLRKRHKLT